MLIQRHLIKINSKYNLLKKQIYKDSNKKKIIKLYKIAVTYRKIFY